MKAICVLGIFLCLGSAVATAGDKKGSPTAGTSVAQLVNELSDKSADVRAAAADALGKRGKLAKDAVPALMKAVKDANDEVRDAAADALGRIGPEAEAAVDVLTEALGDKQPFVRASAAYALGRIKVHAVPAVTALLALLRDPSDDVRESAAQALFTLSPLTEDRKTPLTDAVVPRLCEALKGDKKQTVRALAAECLCEMGPAARDAVATLAGALPDADKSVRVAAAEALTQIGPDAREAVPALAKARTDKEGTVRYAVAEALGAIRSNPTVTVPALIDLLHAKGDMHIRGAAATALGECFATAEFDSFRPQAIKALQQVASEMAKSKKSKKDDDKRNLAKAANSALAKIQR